MKSVSSVSGDDLRADNVRRFPTTLPRRQKASLFRGGVGRGKRNRNTGDLPSILAGRFMHMLRAHDRVRIKVLAAHPTQSR
ncbi:MAG: hypothetical protein ABR501_09350 [Pyrinomonadaceae bacterium]